MIHFIPPAITRYVVSDSKGLPRYTLGSYRDMPSIARDIEYLHGPGWSVEVATDANTLGLRLPEGDRF